MRTHADIDAVNRALDRAMAEKLARDPALFDRARRELERWRARVAAGNSGSRTYLERWQELIDQGLAACLAKLREDSPDAIDLRQASPFVDILTPEERVAVIRTARARHATRGP